MIFTDDAEKRYEDFNAEDFVKTDDALGIKYERDDIFEDTVLLLRYNCPDGDCDIACYGWPDLHKHVKGIHKKVLCDLCTRYKKVFTHEHELFTYNQLRKHERTGDDNPGAIDQSGFKGHPECGFCRERFYGDDELFAHCRDKHERCHICDRRSSGRSQQYYENYDALETHFGKDHFLCADRECLEKKFVVFDSEMDLKAHQLEQHPHGLTKDARRDARRVDMTGFDIRGPRQDDRQNNRREGRGRGRGRDPNADAPLPQSSAQPLRRDEVAYQRQLAIQSAQSVSTRTFGGQLTSNDEPALAARPQPNARNPPTITGPREGSHTRNEPTMLPDISALELSSPHLMASGNMTQAERARQQRHASLTDRATTLLQNDQVKLGVFRSKVSEYRSSKISAHDLIESFFALFDSSTEQLGTLIRELAELFEVAGKKEALLKAWNDWRAINEDYPDLPGATPATTGGGGKRVLRLKSSTAQSGRAAAAGAGAGTSNGPSKGWGTVVGGPSAGARPSSRAPFSEAFPTLPASSKARPSGTGTATWGGSSASSAANSARPSPAPSRTASRAPVPSASSADLFPALPAAQKPGMNISRPGFSGSPYLRNTNSGTSTPVTAWSGSGLMSPPALDGSADDEATSGNKRKGKKKQTLIAWG